MVLICLFIRAKNHLFMEQNKPWNWSKFDRTIVIKTKMKKIGITGSISSGKTTASKILSAGRGPLFSADEVVKNLYKKDSFKNLIRKKFFIKKKI